MTPKKAPSYKKTGASESGVGNPMAEQVGPEFYDTAGVTAGPHSFPPGDDLRLAYRTSEPAEPEEPVTPLG